MECALAQDVYKRQRENGSGDSGVRESRKSPLCHAGKKYLKAFILSLIHI